MQRKWSIMDYKYTVLTGNSRVYVGISWRYKCFIAIFLTVGLLLGIYFLAHGLAKFGRHHHKLLHKQKLLLISVDGFGYNLRNKAYTPNLDWIVANGVSVDHVLNVFPTLTLPNHQSIVTGLYPEHHGILANTMYNKETKEKFFMDGNQTEFWEDAVPIWIENELQGRESGVCFWPGYDVLFEGRQAKYLPSKRYSNPLGPDEKHFMPFDMRVDLVIDWLKKDDVNFAALYIDEPDLVEHKVGPNPSDDEGLRKLKAVIELVDRTIGRVIRGIKKENLESQVNVIIMGDHGQMNLNKANVIDVQKYVNLARDADFFGDGFIFAKPAQRKRIYKKLKEAEQTEGHFHVYMKKDIPEEFHARDHKRTGDIMFLAEPGWMLWTYSPLNRSILSAGIHGYSNTVKEMNPAFFAHGPLFRNNYKKEVVNMLDVYSLMCHILQIKPRKNDGVFNRIKSILKEDSWE